MKRHSGCDVFVEKMYKLNKGGKEMKVLRKTMSVLLVWVLAFGLAACAGGTKPAVETGESNENTNVSDSGEALEVWVRDGNFYEAITTAAKGFTEKTGINVNVVEPSDMSDDLAMALSSGNAPDIVSIDCVLVPYYASIGALADVTSEFEALSFKEAFSGGLLDLASYEDKQYAVPFAPDLSVLLYNKDMFIAAGLDPEKPPTTWEELIDYAKKLTTDDTYGYVFAGGDAGGMMFTFGPYVWSNGGDFTNAEGTESTLDSKEVQGAVQLIVDMVYEHHVTPTSIASYDWTTAGDAFKSQNAAMIVLGSHAVGDIVNGEWEFEAGCALVPSPDGINYASFSGGDSIAILESSDKKEDAWKFVEFCLSEEVQVEGLIPIGNIPARTDLYDNHYFEGNDEYLVLQEALKVGRAPYSFKYNEMYAPWLDALQYALNGEKSVEEAMTEAKTQIDAILAE